MRWLRRGRLGYARRRMIPDLLVILSLGIAVAFLSVAARRLRAAPSILMLRDRKSRGVSGLG